MVLVGLLFGYLGLGLGLGLGWASIGLVDGYLGLGLGLGLDLDVGLVEFLLGWF